LDKLTFAKVPKPAESKTIESSRKIQGPAGGVGRQGEARTVELNTGRFRIFPADIPKTKRRNGWFSLLAGSQCLRLQPV
jgi:hypothetical protein